MDQVEARARELLAAELYARSLHEDAYPVAVGALLDGVVAASVAAIAAALREQTGAVPEGYVLVPEKFGIPADAWEAAAFTYGGPATGEGENYMDCTAWVGYIEDDDGAKLYGLHVSCDECPEEGSITVAEFPEAAPSPPVEQAAGGGGDDAMVERVAIAIYAAKRGFSMAIARDRWANVEQKSRFIGPARDALMGG